MARNKYPEETRIKILEAASRLFLEKGVEHTTIQNIVDNLGGLSKGAIYHHFKNKEEIELAVFEYSFVDSHVREDILQICKDKELSAIEKFIQMIMVSINDPHETMYRKMAPDIKNNPRFLSELMDRWMNVDATLFLLPVVEQGIQEGVINTKYPKQFAELLALLSYIWLNPTLYPVSTEEFRDKIMFILEILQKLDLPVDIDSNMVDFILQLQTDTEK